MSTALGYFESMEGEFHRLEAERSEKMRKVCGSESYKVCGYLEPKFLKKLTIQLKIASSNEETASRKALIG